MSESTASTTTGAPAEGANSEPGATPGSQTTPPEPPAPDPSKLGDPGKAALDQERAARATAERALRAANAKIAEHERSKLTEDQRLQADLDENRTARTTAEATLAKLDAGLDLGLTRAQCMRLNGSTPEELKADAEAFAKELGIGETKPDPKPVVPRSRATLRQTTGGDPAKPDANGAPALNDDALTDSLKAKLGIPD